MRRVLVTVVTAVAIGLLSVGAAGAAGPGVAPFDRNDPVWGCGPIEGGVPPNHCINLKSQGNTGVIKVFFPDSRWPQEGVSTDPKSDSRPCPHDPAATDGTWWSPLPGLWVCHHRP